MSQIYICHTFYHVYITLTKVINKPRTCDLILCNSIPDVGKLKENLEKSLVFKEIIVFDEKLELPKREKIFQKLLYSFKVKQNLKNYVTLDLIQYDKIYIYNDWTRIGSILISAQLHYHLIEDGLNSFKIIDKYADVNFSVKSRILSKMNLTFLPFGQSHVAKSIEVNDIKGIKIKKLNKVIQLPRQEIVSKLTSEHKKKIYTIFADHNLLSPLKRQDSRIVMILTNPLYADGLVDSYERQNDIYNDIVQEYLNNGFIVWIKPHPRDSLKYEFQEKVILLDKNIPVEIFNFDQELKIEKIVTIISTSLDGLKFAKNYEFLGFEWLKEKTQKI